MGELERFESSLLSGFETRLFRDQRTQEHKKSTTVSSRVLNVDASSIKPQTVHFGAELAECLLRKPDEHGQLRLLLAITAVISMKDEAARLRWHAVVDRIRQRFGTSPLRCRTRPRKSEAPSSDIDYELLQPRVQKAAVEWRLKKGKKRRTLRTLKSSEVRNAHLDKCFREARQL